MNTKLAFDFTVNREQKTIMVKREFEAELPLVWDAYTKSEILDQWWAPAPWKARTKRMDFREGGYWLYAMVGPEGETHWSKADYKEIKVQKRFTSLDAFTDSEGIVNEEMPKSKWEVSFSDKGDLTQVEIRISFDDLSQLDATIRMGFKEGLAKAMEGLDELLAAKR
jgi:uncharacterized protein YndB with AHSA1/START domain